MVAAPYMQTQGPNQGVLLEPSDGSSLVTSAGLKRAFEVVAELARLGPPEDAGRCWMEDAGTLGDSFLEGKCLMTVGTFGHFKVRGDTVGLHVRTVRYTAVEKKMPKITKGISSRHNSKFYRVRLQAD